MAAVEDCFPAGEKVCEVPGSVKWSSPYRFLVDYHHGSLTLYKFNSSYYIHCIAGNRRARFLLKQDKFKVFSRESRMTVSITGDAGRGAVSIHLKDAVPDQLQLFLDSLNTVRAHFASLRGASSLSSNNQSISASVKTGPGSSNDLSPRVTSDSSSRERVATPSSSQNTTKDKMVNSVEKQLAKQLECAVCLGRLEDPKVLKCQHLYCKKCLERLVTAGDKISCPQCRAKTKVPGGDVNNLPSNFLVNNLLSIRGDQSNSSSSPACEKHDGEILKLLCQSCDQLICRDCTVIDHRDHKYIFVKDIFPAEKEKVLKIVEESKGNIQALESSITSIKTQRDGIQFNCQKVGNDLDVFIDKQIELLERKREILKSQLNKSAKTQTDVLDAQVESLNLALACQKSSVEFTEEALSRGSEVEVLSGGKQLTELNAASLNLKPPERIHYSLETAPPFDYDMLEKMAKVREYDEGYEFGLLLASGELQRLERVCSFAEHFTNFCIRPKSSVSSDCQNELVDVYVNIIAPGDAQIQPVVTRNSDGSFNFCYNPGGNIGEYKIEVMVNGRYVYGSPFNWVVTQCFKRSMVEKLK